MSLVSYSFDTISALAILSTYRNRSISSLNPQVIFFGRRMSRLDLYSQNACILFVCKKRVHSGPK